MTSAFPNSTHGVLEDSNDAYTACITNAYRALKKRFSQILQKNDSLAKNQKSLRRQLDQALRDNRRIRAELCHQQENYDTLAKETGRISMEKSQIYAQLENERFRRELGDLVLNQYQDEIEERKEEIEREVFKKELGDLLLSQYRDEIEEQSKALREKEIHIETCKESVTAAYGEISTLGSQVLYWRQRVVISEDQICKLAGELERNNGEITRQNTLIAILEKERSEAMDGCRYYQAQITKLKATYDELEVRVDALSINNASEVNELKQRRQRHF
ncbi:hypothetical protein FPOA_06629 [Fusarium poae]|uniref:Uncharacterized protein n=1 Tax=Fusarium poae TaxID=36050 RepID=A0A1B8AI91_FUSPO|nr:hypothetical protein FPOA_06629 [Fusarium poae]